MKTQATDFRTVSRAVKTGVIAPNTWFVQFTKFEFESISDFSASIVVGIMATVLVSETEKLYVLHGVQEDLRVDGRGRMDVRPIVVETDLVTHTSGSAHLRLANSDILVGVKAELEPTTPARPTEGRLEFFVDCSANATPDFEGRGGENLATEISQALARAYHSAHVFDRRQLGVLAGQQCWVLYVDILILECGGNLFDAVSMAVKAALSSTRIPKISVTAVDGGEPELELSDDPFDGAKLDLGSAPILVTLLRIGNFCVVDPTPEEEACASAGVVMGVNVQGQVTMTKKVGSGSFHERGLIEALKNGTTIGVELNRKLLNKLEEEDLQGYQRPKFGFLS